MPSHSVTLSVDVCVLSRLDIVYVALFHLTMTMGSRYVDVEDVVTCVMNHSSSFKLKEVLNVSLSNG